MKSIVLFGMLLGAGASLVQAASFDSTNFSSDANAVERGPNHAVWEWAIAQTNKTGDVFVHTNRYTELQTGLNRFDGHNWVAASEEIEIADTGAVARMGQHQVYFSGEINEEGAVTITMPDGKKLRTKILGLSYTDAATGKSVLIAELKNTQGELLDTRNQVLYRDCFDNVDGVKASVRYTYTKAGIEQDVILDQQLPSPAEWGLDPATTRLEVLTEFFDPPQPHQKSDAADTAANILDFGTMYMGEGKAFSVGRHTDFIPVKKKWSKLENRQFLIEQVDYQAIKPQLETLPPCPIEKREDEDGRASTFHRVNPQRALPVRMEAKKSAAKFKVASVPAVEKGFVLDYNLLSTQTNCVLEGNTTYYVTGPVVLSSNVTIEAGTVVKFAGGSLTFLGPVSCTATNYRPAVFTAKDDNSVGETISGSTGTPVGYYADVALNFCSRTNSINVQNLRIAYARTAIALNGSFGNSLNHLQLFACQTGVSATNATFKVGNALFYNVSTGFCGYNSTAGVAHLTVDSANMLVSNVVLALTNSVLVGVANSGMFTSNMVFSLDRAFAFQTVGAAGHYLAESNGLRSIGTTNIDPVLLASLRTRTTHPPCVYSNVVITNAVTLGRTVPRDSGDLLDLGYHYDALDYAFGGVTANADITFDAGTAVGWFRTSSGWNMKAGHGINMADRVKVSFAGTATSQVYWVRCNTVQEGANGVWCGGYGPGGVTGSAATVADAPTVSAQFTRCSMIEWIANNHFRDDIGRIHIDVANSEFYGGSLGGYWTMLNATNCVFERTPVGLSEGLSDTYFKIRNGTFKGSYVGVSRNYPTPVSVRDCAFDGTLMNTVDSYSADTNSTDFDYNAFVKGAAIGVTNGTHNVLVTNFGWQVGPLGNWYQPATSTLINAGSQKATNVGLYYFTVRTNQAPETNTVVDIGYHYPALDSNGMVLQTLGIGGFVKQGLLGLNAEGSVQSLAAGTMTTLNVTSPDVFVNIDFTSSATSPKVGSAAAPNQTGSDFWNARYGSGQGNLTLADGRLSTITLNLTGVSGSWANGASDPMYNIFCYGGGSMVATINSLPPGTYDFYVYGHGNNANQNGNYRLSVAGMDSGVALTTPNSGTAWLSPTWQEGAQYGVFRGIEVGRGNAVVLTTLTGSSGYSILSGLQIVGRVATGVAPYIMSDPARCTVLAGGSTTLKVTAMGTAPLSYQWNLNGTPISGATSSTLTLTDIKAVQGENNYTVTVQNGIAPSVTSSQATVTVISSAALGRWRFDGQPVATWHGDGNADDSVGSNKGTIKGTVPGNVYYQTAKFGQGFGFGGQNGYVDFGTTAGNFGTSDFTISYWIKTSTTAQTGILEKRSTCNLGNFWGMRLVGGRVDFELCQDTAGTYNNSIVSKVTINTDNQFHNVVVTRQSKTIQMYIDGVLQGAITTAGIVNLSNGAALIAGTSVCVGCDGTQYFTGMLDEITITYGTPWYNEKGAAPLVSSALGRSIGSVDYGFHANSTSPVQLTYLTVEGSGSPNLRCDEGSILFQFTPEWSSGSLSGTGPGAEAPFFEVGRKDSSDGWWALVVSADGTQISLKTQRPGGGPVITAVSGDISWSAGQWYDVLLAYSQGGSALFVNGHEYDGNCIDFVPSLNVRAKGFRIGADSTGVVQVRGTIDEIQTFNYSMSGDSDSDGLPDWWETRNFGDLSQVGAADFDGDGVWNRDEYSATADPNTILYSVNLGNRYFNTASPLGTFQIEEGVPFYTCVMVDQSPVDTDKCVLLDNASTTGGTWVKYSQQFAFSLGNRPDGEYKVRIGVRGNCPQPVNWMGTTVILDRVPPNVTITEPASGKVQKPYLQIKGYANERLSSIEYSVLNASGTKSGLRGQIGIADGNKFVFKCIDVALVEGNNTITIIAKDLAGNASTTTLAYVLDYTDKAPPSLELAWPKNNTPVAGQTFTIRGHTDDETASVSVTGDNLSSPIVGIVERDGTIWVEGVPLADVNNNFTVTVKDVRGNTHEQPISVSKGCD